jgi:DNA replication protein DnaC
LALGLAACQRRHRVRFTTAAALVSELIEARDEKKLLRFQKQVANDQLLIVDELGFVPLSKTGADLPLEVLSQRHERGSTLVTSNLPLAKRSVYAKAEDRRSVNLPAPHGELFSKRSHS